MSTPLHPICQPKPDNEIVGLFQTAAGKIGAEITRHNYSGRIVYSYSGQWGAGSGHGFDHIKKIVEGFKRDNKRLRIIQDLTEE